MKRVEFKTIDEKYDLLQVQYGRKKDFLPFPLAIS